MVSRSTKLAVGAAAAAGVAAYLYYRYRRAKTTTDVKILRTDYKPSPYQIEKVNLNFILTEEEAVTESTIKFVSSGEASSLYLDGEDLTLRSIAIDGNPLVKVPCRPLTPPPPLTERAARGTHTWPAHA